LFPTIPLHFLQPWRSTQEVGRRRKPKPRRSGGDPEHTGTSARQSGNHCQPGTARPGPTAARPAVTTSSSRPLAALTTAARRLASRGRKSPTSGGTNRNRQTQAAGLSQNYWVTGLQDCVDKPFDSSGFRVKGRLYGLYSNLSLFGNTLPGQCHNGASLPTA
jgi:hypothetical protein